MRKCCICHQVKELDEFYKNKTKALGHSYCCKACQKLRDKERVRLPIEIARVARWHKSEHGKMMARLSRAKRHTLNPEKYSAKDLIHSMISKGLIQRQPCVLCGEGNGQGHHPDYSKPLDVMWLCQFHHSQEHKRLNHSKPE